MAALRAENLLRYSILVFTCVCDVICLLCMANSDVLDLVYGSCIRVH
jgi:hypothetical protein